MAVSQSCIRCHITGHQAVCQGEAGACRETKRRKGLRSPIRCRTIASSDTRNSADHGPLACRDLPAAGMAGERARERPFWRSGSRPARRVQCRSGRVAAASEAERGDRRSPPRRKGRSALAPIQLAPPSPSATMQKRLRHDVRCRWSITPALSAFDGGRVTSGLPSVCPARACCTLAA
jgi:hypothetical protein